MTIETENSERVRKTKAGWMIRVDAGFMSGRWELFKKMTLWDFGYRYEDDPLACEKGEPWPRWRMLSFYRHCDKVIRQGRVI